MHPQNIEVVKNWTISSLMIEVYGIFGLASYYHIFLKRFATTASQLTLLTQKEVPFVWFDECEENFLKIKTLLTTTLILSLK